MTYGKILKNQIYLEGENTWGLKLGFLDVAEVLKFVRQVEHLISKYEYADAGNECVEFLKSVLERRK